MSILSNDIKNKIAQQAATLAESTFTGFVKQAVKDSKTFIQQTENDLATWLEDLKQGNMTQKNFESLVRGAKDVAEMRTLKQSGLGRVAIDNFLDGLIQIVINVALSSIHL